MERLIRNADDLNKTIAYLRHQIPPFRVRVLDGRGRSDDQNRLMWLWAAEASRQRQDTSVEDQQAQWKLAIGVPILRVDNDKFNAGWNRIESIATYEQQLALIRDLDTPITSLMTVKQFTEFLDQVQQWGIENGIDLTAPDPRASMPKVGSFHD